MHIWLSFVISCFFVSLAGTLCAPTIYRSGRAALGHVGNFVIMAVLGGMRSFWVR